MEGKFYKEGKMTRRIGKLSLVTLFALGLFSCGGGGGGGGGETSSTAPIKPPYPFADMESDVQTQEPEQVDIAYFKAERDETGQSLEVYFPFGVTLKPQEEEEETTRALTDVTSTISPSEVKIAWSAQEVWITMQDPDSYDTNLFISMELVSGGPIDFDTILASKQYETSDGTGNVTEVYSYPFDVFNTIFVVPKDTSSDPTWKNKGRLRLNFGTNLLAEGASATYWFGGWDLFAEGIKYQINVRANDMPDLNIGDIDTDGDATNDPECPIYVYTDDSGNKVVEFPTKDENGTSYSGTHCIAYEVTAGGDDSSDGETTTLDISKDGGSSWANIFTDNNLSSPYKDTVSLSSNLSAGSWGNDIIFKLTQDVAVNGTTSTVADVKEYRFKTFGANDAPTVTACVTADLSATSCTPISSDVPIDNRFEKEGTYGSYDRYWYDKDGDTYVDDDEPVILYDSSNKKFILPSTGGKIFYTVNHNSTTPHGVFYVSLFTYDGSNLKSHGEYTKNDGAVNGTYVVTVDGNSDAPSDPTHIQVPAAADSSNGLQIRFHVYKDFSCDLDGTCHNAYRSLIGYAPDMYFALNTPTGSGS
jgi:hypothetical protein